MFVNIYTYNQDGKLSNVYDFNFLQKKKKNVKKNNG